MSLREACFLFIKCNFVGEMEEVCVSFESCACTVCKETKEVVMMGLVGTNLH